MRPSLPYQGIARRASGTKSGELPIYDREIDTSGVMPIRQEIEVLPADEPSNVKPAFAVSEQIGPGVVNARGPVPRSPKIWAHDVLKYRLVQQDPGWALIQPPYLAERGPFGEMRDYARINEGEVKIWSSSRTELEAIQLIAQEIVDLDMYAKSPAVAKDLPKRSDPAPDWLEKLKEWIKK